MSGALQRQENLELIRGYTIHSWTRAKEQIDAVIKQQQQTGQTYSPRAFHRINVDKPAGPEYWGNYHHNWTGMGVTVDQKLAVEGEIGSAINPANPASRETAVFDSTNSFFQAQARTFLIYENGRPRRPLSGMISHFIKTGATYDASKVIAQANRMGESGDPAITLNAASPPRFRENPELLARLSAAQTFLESGSSIQHSLEGVHGHSAQSNTLLAARIGVIRQFEHLGIKSPALNKMISDVASTIRARQEAIVSQGRADPAQAAAADLPPNVQAQIRDAAPGLAGCNHSDDRVASLPIRCDDQTNRTPAR